MCSHEQRTAFTRVRKRVHAACACAVQLCVCLTKRPTHMPSVHASCISCYYQTLLKVIVTLHLPPQASLLVVTPSLAPPSVTMC